MKRYDVPIVKYKNVPFGHKGYRIKPYIKTVKIYADSQEEAIKRLEDEGHDVVRKGDDSEIINE